MHGLHPCHPFKVPCLMYHLQALRTLQTWAIHPMPGLQPHRHHMHQSHQVCLSFYYSSVNSFRPSRLLFISILNHVNTFRVIHWAANGNLYTNAKVNFSSIMIIFIACTILFKLIKISCFFETRIWV